MKTNSLLKKAVIFTASLFITSSVFAENSNSGTDDSSKETPTQIRISKDKVDSSAKASTEDDYEENANAVLQEDDYSESEGQTSENATPAAAKKKTNPFKEFLFGKEKYIFFDSTELATGTVGWGIKPRIAEVILNPDTNMAGVQVYFQSSFFNILFDEKNRALIADALEKYLADFDNRKLEKGKYLKTRRAYVKNGKCSLEWGSVKIMMNAFGDTNFTVGYEFKKVNEKNSPYFCIIIEKCKNKNDKAGTYKVEESVEMQLYFTKAQAKQLVKLLGRESINEQMGKYYSMQNGTDENNSTDAITDSY
ncbi:MAG: hypothetical protein ACI4LX_10925 [Treponema sp.]